MDFSGMTISGGVTIVPPSGLNIGDAYGGGYYAGLISTTQGGAATHYLIVAPKATGEATRVAQIPYNNLPSGANSTFNGESNTNALVTGNHPAANFCLDLNINGYTDWYLPAPDELNIAYYNLKPDTTLNVTYSGSNGYAVPMRSNFTTENPARTSVSLFQTGGSEAFAASNYWTSSFATGNGSAYGLNFSNGLTDNHNSEFNTFYVRAFRKIAI